MANEKISELTALTALDPPVGDDVLPIVDVSDTTVSASGQSKKVSVTDLILDSTQTLTNKTLTSPVINTGVSGTAVLDDDSFGAATSTTIATSESIKAYVDAQVDTADTLSEVLAVGNSTGGTDIEVTAGDSIKTDTISETTSATGVTVDSVLLKDGTVTGDVTGNVTGNVTGDLTGDVTGDVTGDCSGTAATVTGATQASITSAANLVTVGTIGTGVWQGTAIDGDYVDIEGTEVKSAGPATDGYVLTADGSGGAAWESAGSGSGTVTSVAITGTDGIDVDSGSPITTSGTITLGLSGIANAALTNSSVSYGGVSVSLGASDATPAFNLSDATAYAGDSSLVTTGTVTSGTWGTGAVVGGATMTLGSDAEGDVYYRNASGVLTRLGVGSDADVLTLASGVPSWATPTAGTVTSITAAADSGSGTGITTSGTLTFTGGTNVTTSVSGTTVTVDSTDQYSGTVTSVGGTGTVNGLTLTGTVTGSGNLTLGGTLPVEIGIACSDETTALTTGTGKATFRLPHAMTLTSVRASVTTAPAGSVLTVDINESGSTVLSTKVTIDAGEKTSTTAATPPVISDSSLADDAEITVDIDTIGSGTAGAGLKIWLIGTR